MLPATCRRSDPQLPCAAASLSFFERRRKGSGCTYGDIPRPHRRAEPLHPGEAAARQGEHAAAAPPVSDEAVVNRLDLHQAEGQSLIRAVPEGAGAVHGRAIAGIEPGPVDADAVLRRIGEGVVVAPGHRVVHVGRDRVRARGPGRGHERHHRRVRRKQLLRQLPVDGWPVRHHEVDVHVVQLLGEVRRRRVARRVEAVVRVGGERAIDGSVRPEEPVLHDRVHGESAAAEAMRRGDDLGLALAVQPLL